MLMELFAVLLVPKRKEEYSENNLKLIYTSIKGISRTSKII
jgi:hypothetical protein